MQQIFKALNFKDKFPIAYAKFHEIDVFNSPPSEDQKKLYKDSERIVNKICAYSSGNRAMLSGQQQEGKVHGFICRVNLETGQIEEGYCKNGQTHGKFRVISNLGDCSLNEFYLGKRVGEYACIFSNGTIGECLYEDGIMKTSCFYYPSFNKLEYEVTDGQGTDNVIKRNKWRWNLNKTHKEEYDE